ncbi:MAG: cache domain-containing protein [Burkholderiaceae bacterium]
MKKLIKKTILIFSFMTITTSSSMAKEEDNSYGNETEAKNMLERVIRIVDSNPTVAFAMINVGQGGFHVKDLYPFCFDNKGIMVAHPTLAGTDMTNFTSSDGVKVAQIMLQKAKSNKFSKISYNLNRTISSPDGLPIVTKKESKKITFYSKVGNYTCATGFHPS